MSECRVEPSDRILASFAADDEESFNRRALTRSMRRANKTLVIHFTPRSGSSWLGSVLESTERLGRGIELYNPAFIPKIAKHFGARSLAEYVDLANFFISRGGVVSLEVTSHQIIAAFAQPRDFFELYSDCPSFWLIREDIVSQAVSLAKMQSTGLAHAPHSDLKSRILMDDVFSYDGDQILRWLEHILAAERNSEEFFHRHNVKPYRLSYERIMSKDVGLLLSEITGAAGLPDIPSTCRIETDHKKLATPKSRDFADRFREEHNERLKVVAIERSTWLKKLT